jgi:hypothetical protein
MRSGSSLLTHILNSNPEIIGYGETHISYQSLQDLKKLTYKVYWTGQEYRQLSDLSKLFFSEKYILDKLLHNNKLLNTELLSLPNLYVVFLAREPHRSLKSILDLKPHWSEVEAVTYYCERLNMLLNYAKIINSPSRALLLRHDQLIHESPLVFASLQKFLGTQTSFSEKYNILKTTGKKHVGDHRGEILAGQIIKKPREIKQVVSESALSESQAVYEHFLECMSQLTSNGTDTKEPKSFQALDL